MEATDLISPDIRLHGDVDNDMLDNFFRQLDATLEKDPERIVVELSTSGGIADIGRRIALEIRLCREHRKIEMVFFGTTTVYSAGVSIMAAFLPERRFLSKDAVLLIHERERLSEELPTGPISTLLQLARKMVAELERGQELEQRGFEELIAGSKISQKEICERATSNWYLTAEEALERGLVAGIV